MRIHTGTNTFSDSGYDGPDGLSAWSIGFVFRGNGGDGLSTGWEAEFGWHFSTLISLGQAGVSSEDTLQVNLWDSTSGGSVQLQVSSEDSAYASTMSAWTLAGGIAVATDYRACLTYDGTSLALHLDGTTTSIDETDAFGGSSQQPPSSMVLGLTQGITLIPQQSSEIGDLAFWNRALSAAEGNAFTSTTHPRCPVNGLQYFRHLRAAGRDELVSQADNSTTSGGSFDAPAIGAFPGLQAKLHQYRRAA